MPQVSGPPHHPTARRPSRAVRTDQGERHREGKGRGRRRRASVGGVHRESEECIVCRQYCCWCGSGGEEEEGEEVDSDPQHTRCITLFDARRKWSRYGPSTRAAFAPIRHSTLSHTRHRRISRRIELGESEWHILTRYELQYTNKRTSQYYSRKIREDRATGIARRPDHTSSSSDDCGSGSVLVDGAHHLFSAARVAALHSRVRLCPSQDAVPSLSVYVDLSSTAGAADPPWRHTD